MSMEINLPSWSRADEIPRQKPVCRVDTGTKYQFGGSTWFVYWPHWTYPRFSALLECSAWRRQGRKAGAVHLGGHPPEGVGH